MFSNKSRAPQDGEARQNTNSYPLSWPSSQRWNAQYSVPRNSLDDAQQQHHASLEEQLEHLQRHEEEKRHDDLSHWLETLAELYMNNLDNLARWDPRWLNMTHRERFEGLSSAFVTVVDYLAGESAPRSERISGKKQLAVALQSRPENSEVRVVLVSDLSRFVMGALGQVYSIDPEFWYEHLVNSGYAASDSQLKVFNAVWMNWAARETRFRHRALPGPGQRTEWNLPRRAKGRSWTHLRWGRLGQLHYLGRKGFYEHEIEKRLGDGRWVMERDVILDKYGRLMTKKREARAKRAEEKRQKKKHPSSPTDETWSRTKATNVYRAYSTFEGLPKNVSAWRNRDLRVLAPEAASYWTGQDQQGKQTIVLLFDPMRNMKHQRTTQVTPTLTFMPRALEIESFSEEELWRTPDVDETFLDPPPPRLSKKEQKKTAKKQRIAEKRERLQGKLDKDDGQSIMENDSDDSSDTGDSEYDDDYEKGLREDYSDPKPHARDRDFARKYTLPTHDLFLRHLNTIATADMVEDTSVVPAILTRMLLDDSWRLLAEIRLELDQLDNDFSADLYDQLVELVGNSTRQNVYWMRTTLQELCEWAAHVTTASSAFLCPPADMVSELELFNADVQALRSRADETINLLTASMGLAQSSLVIDQTSGINKLTELAFFFVPVSFITSVFSMQVRELLSAPPAIWTWGLSLALVVLVTYLIRSALRSPSVRVAVLHCRATIISRFSSANAGSASRRLNTVGNRAIIKFLFFLGAVVFICSSAVILMVAFLLLVFGGIWLGAAAAALYFIITRWPEPAVLIPCFIALPVAFAGMGATWFWSDEILDWGSGWSDRLLAAMRMIFPERWTLDSVDDDDLAKEGVNTYARQALVLAT